MAAVAEQDSDLQQCGHLRENRHHPAPQGSAFGNLRSFSIAEAERLLECRPPDSSLQAVHEAVQWLIQDGQVRSPDRQSGSENNVL
jgi:hypothetical protein